MATRSTRQAARWRLLGAVLLGPLGAAAADPLPYGSFEVAPFIGYQLGGNFTDLQTGQHYSLDDHAVFALALDAPADHSSQYELFYSRQPTVLRGAGFAPLNVVVEYLQVGGTIPLDESSRARPYLAGGLGLTRFTPDDPAGRADTVFSMSLALGLRMPVTRHLSVRLEGRGALSFMDSSSAVFCHSGQAGAVCHITASGSGQYQFTALAGLAYIF
jgi:opacity protein-like surface antigen